MRRLPSSGRCFVAAEARSTGVALFAEGPALAPLWLFWVAPLIGGALGALVWKAMAGDD